MVLLEVAGWRAVGSPRSRPLVYSIINSTIVANSPKVAKHIYFGSSDSRVAKVGNKHLTILFSFCVWNPYPNMTTNNVATLCSHTTQIWQQWDNKQIPFSSPKESLVQPKGITGPTLSRHHEYTFTQTNAHIIRRQCPLKS